MTMTATSNSSAHAPTATAFPLPDNVLPNLVALNARWRPRRPALVHGTTRLDWGTLSERVDRVANGLIALGVRKGDTVGTLMPNALPMLEIMLGILRAGAVLVPLSTMLTAETLANMARDARVRALFVHRDYANILHPQGALAKADANHADLLPDLLSNGWIAVEHSGAGWHPYDAWLAAQSTTPPEVAIKGEDRFNIIYSSGTTGVPKGIVHSHAARFNFAWARIADFRISRDSVILIATPLYHNGSMLTLLPALMAGATIVVMPRFDARATLDLIERERCTHSFMVPSQYVELVAQADFAQRDLSSLVMALTGGAAIRRDTKLALLDKLGDALMELYGATEGFSITVRGSEMRERLDSVGTPVPGADVRVVGADDREVAPGEVGELCGRSPFLMNGYHNQPELTAETLWRDSAGRCYYRSGDLGRYDEQGFFYISGRKKEMIISGGINIYTQDLEQILNQHPSVADCAVIGAPHTKWGETPIAYVVRRPHPAGQTPAGDETSILEWANQRLGKFQRIAEVHFIDALPRNAMGKIVKPELRALYAQHMQHAHATA